MEFDETRRFWYPRVACDAYINFAFCSNKSLRSDFRRSKRETKRRIFFFSLSILRTLSVPPPHFSFILTFIYLFIFIIFFIFFLFVMCRSLIRVRFYPETIYLFSVQFILNELNLSNFPSSEIFVKISSLESLAAYHQENR